MKYNRLVSRVRYIVQYFGKTELSESDLLTFRDQEIDESVNIDYKRYQVLFNNFDEIAKDITAFANSNGGLLFIGFKEKKVEAQTFPDEIDWGNSRITPETIENRLHSRIKPYLPFVIKQVWNEIQDGHVFLIDVPKGENAPYWCKKGFYRRRDRTSEKMDYDEIKNMFYIRQTKQDKINDKIITPILNTLYSYVNSSKYKGSYLRYDIKLNEGSINGIIYNNGHYYNKIDELIKSKINGLIIKSRNRNKVIGSVSNDLRYFAEDIMYETRGVELVGPRFITLTYEVEDHIGEKRDLSLSNLWASMYGTTPEDYILMQREDIRSVKRRLCLITAKDDENIDESKTYFLKNEDFEEFWQDLQRKVNESKSLQFLKQSTEEMYNDCIELISDLENAL